MTSFKSRNALAILRKAVAFIVQRNDDVMGRWHDISVIIDLCNVVAGYEENSSNMRGVDVTMVDDAFITKPLGTVCIPYEDMLGDDDGYFLHLKHGNNDKVEQIACSQSRDASQISSVEGGAHRLKNLTSTTKLNYGF